MSRRTKLGLAGIAVVIVVVVIVMSAAKRGDRGQVVRIAEVGVQDLVATVTASGTIRPKTKVDISADITGRITKIGVEEGDWVEKNQFLVQIDAAPYEAAVNRAAALLASGEASMLRAEANRAEAERNLRRARNLHDREGLISEEAFEQSQTAYDVSVANYQASKAQVDQYKASVDEAQEQLAKTRLTAPMAGRVVRLPVEVGEVAVPGTFSRESALLLTIADMSEILAEVQVDETDVVRLAVGDSVRITIDAYPDTAFVGFISRISHSARLTATRTAAGSSDRAVDFDVEITLADPPSDIRPDLSATARIVTDIQKEVLAIPIIALTVRDHEVLPNENVEQDSAAVGHSEETEGVFIVRDGLASFIPVDVGIAGEEHFQVLSGLQ
ncbi:MAG: efflux RND transporter periplasmic adaptor subunit, partial [Gemmatimonadales bacterium]